MKLSSKFLIPTAAVFLAALVLSSGFAAGVTSFLATNSGLAPAPLVTVPGSVLPITSGATAVGTPAGSTNVQFSIILPLRNLASLKTMIQGAYTPKSSNYRQFLTPSQVAAQFAPTTSDFTALKNYLISQGLQITYSASNNLIISASGNLSAVSNALNTQFGTFSKAGTTFFTNTQPVRLPNTVAAAAVMGLTNFSVVKPAYVASNAIGSVASTKPSDLSDGFIGGPYLPQQIQAAYQAPIVYTSGWQGTGVTVALVDAYDAPTAVTDLANYDFLTGLPDPPSVSIVTPTGAPTVGSGSLTGWDFETSLDLQQAHALAPQANILLALSYDAYDSLFATVNYLVSQGPGMAAAISQSWGSPEPFLTPTLETGLDQIYMLAAIEGISVFASTGDSGGANGFSFLNVQYPAASPYITAVGGTTAFFDTVNVLPSAPYSTGGGIIFQTAWSWDMFGGSSGWGTGGGQSAVFSPPFYQTFTTGIEGTVNRTIPDISGIADPNTPVLMIIGPYIYAVGGTSVSSPEWAGIAALLDQILANFAGEHATAGLLNPSLYLGTHTFDYVDVTVGNNQGDFFSLGSNEPVGYNATTGYDPVTGFGTPNLSNLLNTLYTIDILPTVRVNPAFTVYNGSATFEVQGTGFTPSNTVNLSFTFVPTAGVANFTIPTNSTGGFDVFVTTFAGTGQWDVVAQDNANSQIATTSFFAGPLLNLNPSTVHEGTVLNITGYFFPASTAVNITIDFTPITTLHVTTDLSGSFTTTLVVPPQAASSAMVLARDAAGDQAQGLLTVQPFMSLNATSGGAGTPVHLSAVSFDGGDTVHLTFGATVLGNFGTNGNGDFAVNFNVPNVAPGLYTITGTDSLGHVATTTFNITAPAGYIAAALANTFSQLPIPALGASQQFFTNSSGGTVNSVKVYLTGTGSVTLKLGNALFSSSIYTTTIAVSGAGWYNVTLPSPSGLASSSSYYISIVPISGTAKWAYTSAWTYSLNVGTMYYYTGTYLGGTSSFSFLFIVS